MTEVVPQSSPSYFSSPSSSPSAQRVIPNDTPHQPHFLSPTLQESDLERSQEEGNSDEEDEECIDRKKEREREGDQLSLVALLVAAFRRSIVGCSISGSRDFVGMDIGLPTNVRHVAHVTFDRFNGFLGLPVEFEPEVPRRAPSASATVFGVSTESMQLSYDLRGNSVPTILLMMQKHLYAQGGLQAEGIFRITAGNSQEEYVREQLNRGVIPVGVDAHCLAGLVKAWFRELPTGILDSLSPEQVMQCRTEEECAQLARLLPPTEAGLLDWALNLMADVVQMEHLNKMNARNIATVFAPNMTQMSDPLTSLMYVVQVMNFLRTLIDRTLRERDDSSLESTVSSPEPSDENEPQSSSQPIDEENIDEVNNESQREKVFIQEEPVLDSRTQPNQDDTSTERGCENLLTSIENIPGGSCSPVDNYHCEVVSQICTMTRDLQDTSIAGKSGGASRRTCKIRSGQSSYLNPKKGSKKPPILRPAGHPEKGKGASNVGHINSRTEKFEAWR